MSGNPARAEVPPISIVLCADTSPVRPFGELHDEVNSVFDVLRRADFSLANVEIPLTMRGHPIHKLLNIRAEPDRAEDLARAGVKLATLANNHAVDYGWEGLVDTAEALEKAGIQSIGMGTDATSARALHICTVDGLRIGTLAFSCLTPTGMGASADRPGISALHVRTSYEIDPWYQMEEPGDPGAVKVRTCLADDELVTLRGEIAAARQKCDVLIATVHWGFGSSHALADYQAQLAHELINAGVDIVHGHHPHALQPIEFYQGCLIIYSANVFIGQQVLLPASDFVHKLWSEMSPFGFITCIKWHRDGAPVVRLLPTRLDADRLPRFAQQEEMKAMASHLNAISKTATVIEQDSAILVSAKNSFNKVRNS